MADFSYEPPAKLTDLKARRCSDPHLIGCRQEAAPRRQPCEECWLRKQPPVIRAEAAKHRLSLIPEQYRVPKIDRKKWPAGRRWCAGCQTFVLLIDAGGSRCKACASIASHKTATAARFGIDDETYQWLLDQQLGKCAICRSRPKTMRMAVDHDHKHEPCGGKGCRDCVRGLLCARCNHELLGAAHDSINILRNAVAYLEQTPMSGEWEVPAYEREKWEAEHGPDVPMPPF